MLATLAISRISNMEIVIAHWRICSKVLTCSRIASHVVVHSSRTRRVILGPRGIECVLLKWIDHVRLASLHHGIGAAHGVILSRDECASNTNVDRHKS